MDQGLDADLLCCSACASSCSVDPHAAQSESARLDCPSAPFKSGAPPTTTCFTSLLTDPPPHPLRSPHSPTPTLLPHPPSSQTGPRTLSHAVGAYVFHLDSPPHLWACRSPGACRPPLPPNLMSSCLIKNRRRRKKKNQNHIPPALTTSIATRRYQNCNSFHVFFFFKQLQHSDVVVINSITFSFVLYRLRFQKYELITDEKKSKGFWYQRGIVLSFSESEARGHKTASQSLSSVEKKRQLEISGLVAFQNISNSPRNHQQLQTPSSV